MKNHDTFLRIIRGYNDGKSYYRTVLYSKNPHENPKIGTYKQFNLDYKSHDKRKAELYAYKLAQCLGCAVKE